ncbi:MAG: LysR family transcriptional regulator [Ktedonobacteraceae bacterium]|nr:LysR family transcriptional regulator [Ktedonobacteraceae bacterium]
MELRHLRYFVVVARKRHFTHAAEELFIAQPALSQQIQALELELGVKLFERTSRQVRLTPAGEAFLIHAERILEEVEQMKDEMQEFMGLIRGRVKLGLLQSLGAFRVPALLGRFSVQYPGIEMILQEGVTEHLLEQLRIGQLDIALTHSIGDIFPLTLPDSQMITETLLSEELVLVAGPHHRLAHVESIAAGELKDEAFILFKPGSGLRQAAIHLSTIGGFAPRILYESGDVGTIRALVAEGLGISVLPQSIVDSPGSEVTIIKVAPPLPARTVLLVWHKRIEHSPAASTFLNFLHEDIQAHSWNSVR